MSSFSRQNGEPYTLSNGVQVQNYSVHSGHGNNDPLLVRLNPYSSTWFNCKDHALLYWSYSSISFGSLSNNFLISALPDPWTPNDEINLQNGLFEKIRGSNFNGGVVSAEANKTIGMCVDAVKAMTEAALALRRGSFGEAAQALGVRNRYTSKTKTFSDAWLQMQYGWRPLLGTISEADKARAAMKEPPPRVHKCTFGMMREYRSIEDTDLFSRVSVRRHGKRYNVYFQDNTTTKNALGFDDPYSVAWELLPYSFVIDWFLPVSSYLAAVDGAHLTKQAIDVLIMEKDETESVVQLKPPKSSWTIGTVPYYNVSGPVSGRLNIGSFNRTPNATIPSPPLPEFKPFKQGATPEHWANALALFRSAMR